MKPFWIEQQDAAGTMTPSDAFIACSLSAAKAGDVGAYFDMGIAFSTASHGLSCDLIEAHKWFNIAASRGHEESEMCRVDLAGEMLPGEVAEAQRRARAWLGDIQVAS